MITYYVPMEYPDQPDYRTVTKISMPAGVNYRCVRKLLKRWARINHGINMTSSQAGYIVSHGRKIYAQAHQQRTPAS